MKTLTALGLLGSMLVVAVGTADTRTPAPAVVRVPIMTEPASPSAVPVPVITTHTKVIPPEVLTAVVKQYCVTCHSAKARAGNVSLETFDVAAAAQNPEIAEKMIHKLRLAMMPPPGSQRPAGDTLQQLYETLEQQMDAAARANPNPGHRSFQRLNRAEYTRAIRELLSLDIDAGTWLPLDTKSENFDNIADVQVLSPTLLDSYLRAASEISWMAVGNPKATPKEATFNVPRTASQTGYVEGAPFGSRGGVVATHTFPADGEYSFRVSFYHETTGAFAGGNARGEKIEVSIDGEPVVVLDVDQWMNAGELNGVELVSERAFVKAGQHKVAAVFIPPAFQGVVQDLISPLKWSLNSTSNATAYGFSLLPHLRDFVIAGPFKATGVSDSPIRRAIFTCQPKTPGDERPCAQSIIGRIGMQAFRRPLTNTDLDGLMGLYDSGAGRGGFESGVRTALEAILASPDFVFRFEHAPESVKPGDIYKLSDIDLASRLAFFLWSAPPDQTLLKLARDRKLSDQKEFERQVRRMLADPKAEALATRFASQWLRLPDLEKVQPDVRQYPDFDEQLRADMRRETELFFLNLVQEDRSALELFTANYTFVNQRLAQHYGISNVAGTDFRRVTHGDPTRVGLFGHASLLTLTSHAGRTSAVDRGKWVMEVFLNSPPPPPPPGVPDLEATPGTTDGRPLTVRERMEQHRRSPTCRSCHAMMDPIGLALENFDVTGRWRVRDNGMPIDSKGQLWDGTPVQSPLELRDALLKRPEPLMRTFTRNLMAYALGRRVEYYDMPTIRAITAQAAANNYKMSSYIMGVVNSPAFRMQRAEAVTDESR